MLSPNPERPKSTHQERHRRERLVYLVRRSSELALPVEYVSTLFTIHHPEEEYSLLLV
jgi:hypothetical protein